jgi:hypothetical protein
MRPRRALGAAALLAAGAVVSAVAAQELQADLCAVSIGRGATGLGGAAGTMTVRNLGRACRVVNFSVPEDQTPAARLEVTKGPSHGQVDVIQPNIVAYTPSPGYAGPDEFHYTGSGPGRQGRTLPFSVRIQVRVVGPGDPLR